MSGRIKAGIVAVAGMIATSAGAATQDRQGWATLFVSAPVGGGFQLSGEAIDRVVDDVGRNGQLELRLEVGHPLSKRVTLWGGYVRTQTYVAGGRDGIENQMVEQANWLVGSLGHVAIASRTRLEQRFLRDVARTGWRVREQVRLSLPVSHGGTALIAWAEPFVALNRNGAVPSGLDQLRTFGGVAVPVSRRLTVEAGYLNQYLHRPDGDRVNHAVSLVFNARL